MPRNIRKDHDPIQGLDRSWIKCRIMIRLDHPPLWLCEKEEGRAQKAGREGQNGTLQSVITGMNYTGGNANRVRLGVRSLLRNGRTNFC